MSASSSHATRQRADASYRPKGYGISPSLQRARAPFRTKNALTGVLMGGFAVAVWAYSITAVKQDNFDDVDAQALNVTPEERAKIVSLEDEERAKEKAKQLGGIVAETVEARIIVNQGHPASNASPTPVVPSSSARGLASNYLGNRFGVLHPAQGTLVWGAPSVDRVGTMWDRRTGNGW